MSPSCGPCTVADGPPDPTPLRTLAIRTRLLHTQRSVPQPTQRSPLSPLQKFVKDARKLIVDPVLASTYDNADPACNSPNPTHDPCTPFEAESAPPMREWAAHDEPDDEQTQPTPPPTTDLSARPSRVRKPSLRLQSHVDKDPSSTLPSPTSLGKRSREPSQARSGSRKARVDPLASSTDDTSTETNRLRSDTYKQAWSISEQHLLERLLTEIPDGERNRYEACDEPDAW